MPHRGHYYSLNCQHLTITMNTESVEASVIDVAMVGNNVQFDKLESLVSHSRVEHLDRLSVVIVGESAEKDRIGIVIRRLQTENEKVFRRRVD